MISQKQIKHIGEVAELHCSVQFCKGYSVQWIRIFEDFIVPLSSDFTIPLSMLDSRMDIKGIFNTTTSTYIFQIKDIKEDDAGVYRCRAIRSINEFYDADVELQINKPPFISDNSTLSVVVVEGKEAQLVCDVSGFPPPTITWHRENKVLPTNRSIYQ